MFQLRSVVGSILKSKLNGLIVSACPSALRAVESGLARTRRDRLLPPRSAIAALVPGGAGIVMASAPVKAAANFRAPT